MRGAYFRHSPSTCPCQAARPPQAHQRPRRLPQTAPRVIRRPKSRRQVGDKAQNSRPSGRLARRAAGYRCYPGRLDRDRCEHFPDLPGAFQDAGATCKSSHASEVGRVKHGVRRRNAIKPNQASEPRREKIKWPISRNCSRPYFAHMLQAIAPYFRHFVLKPPCLLVRLHRG